MKVVADFCLVPIGVGVSLSPYIAECQRLCEESGLNFTLHAYGTNIEGSWDEVMSLVKRCHERVHELGAPRISTSLKVGSRTDKEQSLASKLSSVTQELKR